MESVSPVGAIPELLRSGDCTFQYEEERAVPLQEGAASGTQSVTVSIALPEGSARSLPEFRGLLGRIVKNSIEQKRAIDSVTYLDKLTGKSWRVVKRSSYLVELGTFLQRKNVSNLIHTLEPRNREQYELQRIWSLWEVIVEILRYFFPKEEEKGEYSLEFPEKAEAMAAPRAAAFRELAARAYREVEQDFEGRDEGSAAGAFTADTAVILKDGKLQLVPKNEAEGYRSEAEEALKCCFIEFIREVGNEKLEEAERLSKFSFAEMIASFRGEGGAIVPLKPLQPLTPEHIYRLSIITSMACGEELNSLGAKLALLNLRLQGVEEKTPLEEYFKELLRESTIWPERHLRKLLQVSSTNGPEKKGAVTAGELREWLERFPLKLSLPEKMRLLAAAALSVAPDRYRSLEELIENHSDLEGLFSKSEKELLLQLTEAVTGREEAGARDFIAAHQEVKHLYRKAGELPKMAKGERLEGWLAKNFSREVSDSKKAAALASRLMGKEEATVGEFESLLCPLLEELPCDRADELIAILRPGGEEVESAYCGRKILQPIDSSYTLADTTFYKPWVDIQEFLQASRELEGESVVDPYTGEKRRLSPAELERRFNEYSAFILCKKHLFTPHNEEGYRVGALIPAPPTPEGRRRWYRVSRLIASHDGILSYHLEPVGKNSGLKSCVVSRSTSGDPYAYESEATIKNNGNPIQDPGYLGRRHIDKYLDRLRRDHTFPAWVAYQTAARREIESGNEGEAYRYLLRATEELQREPSFHCYRKGLHEIVKEFDGEFVDLMGKDFVENRWKEAFSLLKMPAIAIRGGKKKGKKLSHSQFRKAVLDAAHKATKEKIAAESAGGRREKTAPLPLAKSLDAPSFHASSERQDFLRRAEEKKSAKLLLAYIARKAPREEGGELQQRYSDLVNAIGDNIFRDNEGEVDDKYKKFLEKSGYSIERGGWREPFERKESEVAPIVEKCTPFAAEKSAESVKKWEKVLREYSESIGEDFDSKKKNGLIFNGHSLGGSTAQVETFLATAGSNRLPASSISANLYDDPGFNEEDNIDHYSFMLNHLDVLHKIGSKVEVYRSLDHGDPAPLCASSHLGALTSGVERRIRERAAAIDPEKDSGFLSWQGERGGSGGDGTPIDYIKERLDALFPCRTRMNKTTKYALEKEFNYPYKHGVRYEGARVERGGIVRIAEGVLAGGVDLERDFGLLANYLKNIFSESDQEFKRKYEKIYSDGEKCAAAFCPGQAPHFLELMEKRKRGARLTPAEGRQFEGYRKEGLLEVYNHADRLRQQEKILAVIGKLHDGEAEKVVNEMIQLIDRYGEKREKAAKQILTSGYGKPLEIVKSLYEVEMKSEAKRARAQSIGGVEVTWIDKEKLAALSGKRESGDIEAAEYFGFGLLHAKRMEAIRKFIGRFLFPAFMQSLYSDEERDKMLSLAGHGEAISRRDKVSKALVVDEYGGPIAG